MIPLGYQIWVKQEQESALTKKSILKALLVDEVKDFHPEIKPSWFEFRVDLQTRYIFDEALSLSHQHYFPPS